MPNPTLTKEQLVLANELLASVRSDLARLAGDDLALLFAMRRKIAKELVYDERSKPAHRRRLKKAKIVEQNGMCPVCDKSLPESDNVLDRTEAIHGYTTANTRLICRGCDTNVQRSRGYQ